MKKIMRKSLMMAVICAGVAPVLSGCSGDGWFGEDEAPPLPGNRISVLALDEGVKTDIDAKDLNIILPKPEGNTEWGQTGGLSHHAMSHLKVGAKLQPVWETSIGSSDPEENRLVTSPVVGGGSIFTMDALAHITAFDANSGVTQWRFDLTPDGEDEGSVRGGGLAYDDGRLFAATGVGELWAIEAKSGGFYWKQKLEAPLRAAPTVYGGRVFVVTTDNRVVAFAARDGKKLWEYLGANQATGLLGAASPAADDGVLMIAMRNGAVAALRAESGSLLWDDSLASSRKSAGQTAFADVKASPVMYKGRAYAIGNGGFMASIDIRTGTRMWTKAIGGVDLPWLAGNYMYVLSNTNELVALEARTGRVAWVTPLSSWEDPEDRTGRIIWTGPILASDRLLVAGSHGYALSISPYTGKITGYARMPDGVTIPPVVANGTVYFVTDEAELIAFR